MDLQSRKIHFVQEFLRLNNEIVIIKLEEFLRKEKIKLYSDEMKPKTIEELNSMIDNAEEDSKSGRLTNAHELKQDINSWI